MTSPARGAWRPARAGALTVVTVVLAAGSHASAGGSLPSWWVLLAMSVPTAVAAFAVTGRRLSTPSTLAGLGAAQVLLHEGFTALSTSGTGSAHHAVTTDGTAAAGHGSSLGMLLAHVVATVLTGFLLARGEQALWALADRLAWTVPVLRRVVLPVRVRLPRPVERRVRPRVVVAVVPVRRGPPVRLRATA